MVAGNTYIANSSSTYQNYPGSSSLLLWNRSLADVASSSYSTYKSSTMNADDIGTVRVYSLMCLSCHDGVSAMNVLSSYPTETVEFWGGDPFNTDGSLKYVSSGEGSEADPTHQFADIACVPGNFCGNIGERDSANDVINLANDHPISFDYDSQLWTTDDVGLKPATTSSGGGYVQDPRVRLFPNTSGDFLSMECSTCHDVHNYGVGAQQPFLVMPNTNSVLCTNCHIK